MKFKIGDRVVRVSIDKEVYECGGCYGDYPIGTEAVVEGFAPKYYDGYDEMFDIGIHCQYYMYNEDWELAEISLENE